MIDIHQNVALSESLEGDKSRVIGNRCKPNKNLNGKTYIDCIDWW